MRMAPPLRGAWASAAAESASPKPATIAIFLNIMSSPSAQEFSHRRVDHSQHVKRKAVLTAIWDQYLCSLNARDRTTIGQAARGAPSGPRCQRRVDQHACQMK